MAKESDRQGPKGGLSLAGVAKVSFSIGSIVVTTAFLSVLFPHFVTVIAVGVATIALTMCVVCAVLFLNRKRSSTSAST